MEQRKNFSLSAMSQQKLQQHLDKDTYGDFVLTDAIRPGVGFTPREGYRFDTYIDQVARARIPVIMAAATRQKLFPLFRELMDLVGDDVNAVLETSHVTSEHVHVVRDNIDMPVLDSTIIDFEDLLVNDGCTGIAVCNPQTIEEVQLDEHKMIVVYAPTNDYLRKYVNVLERHGVREDAGIQFITEQEHIHSSSDDYFEEFGRLCIALSSDDGDGSDSSGSPHEPWKESLDLNPDDWGGQPDDEDHDNCV